MYAVILLSSVLGLAKQILLDGSHTILASLYSNQSRSAAAANHTRAALALKEGILDLFWDTNKRAFYDFNITSNARGTVLSAANFYPLWNNIIPTEVLADGSGATAFGVFSSLNLVLNRYNGTYPATFHETGLQWLVLNLVGIAWRTDMSFCRDAPNTWPMHQHIILQALRNLPSNITGSPLPNAPSGSSTYALIPSGQIDVAEDHLPGQLVLGARNASTTGSAADTNTLNGTVFNGGNDTEGLGWAAVLERELANRYIASALCSW